MSLIGDNKTSSTIVKLECRYWDKLVEAKLVMAGVLVSADVLGQSKRLLPKLGFVVASQTILSLESLLLYSVLIIKQDVFFLFDYSDFIICQQ